MSAQDLRPTKADLQFFVDHPDRKARIRKVEDRENIGEFWSLGPHDSSRRRMLLWRVPDGHAMKKQYPFLKIPFLTFADETIEDDDKTLLPLIDQIMKDAKAKPSM